MAGKHTPGPWRLVRSIKTWQMPLQIEAADGTCIVALEAHPLHNMDANARLIAAAPDLLEALIELRGFAARVADGVDAGSVEEYIEQADAAITRATQPLPPPNEEV